MFRLPDEYEALHAAELVQRALTDGRIIDLSYFTFYRYPKNSPGMPYGEQSGGRVWFKDSWDETFGRRPALSSMPETWRVEPVELKWTGPDQPVPWSVEPEPAPYVTVIKHDPNGPAYRSVRLDHVAVTNGRLSLRVLSLPMRFAGTALEALALR